MLCFSVLFYPVTQEAINENSFFGCGEPLRAMPCTLQILSPFISGGYLRCGV